MALNLEEDNVGCVIFGEISHIKEGDTVKRTGSCCIHASWRTNAGRVMTPLGHLLMQGTIKTNKFLPLERKALGVIAPKSGERTFANWSQTGGRYDPDWTWGNGELIIGDRQTGKTAIAIDTIINQKYTHTERQRKKASSRSIASMLLSVRKDRRLHR